MDQRIVDALTATAPPSGASGAVMSLWSRLQAKLAEYDECVVTNRGAEGLNLSMSIDAAARQVAEYHAAYRQLTGAAAAAPGQNPAVYTSERMGHTVDFSLLSLHRL